MKIYSLNIALVITSLTSIAQVTVTNNGLALKVDGALTLTIKGGFVNKTDAVSSDKGTIDNEGTITLTHNWLNNSDNTVYTTNDGTTSFIGTGNNQTIGGSYPTEFFNLTLNNTFASTDEFDAQENITAKGTLTMSQGNVNMNSNNFTIGRSAANPGALVHGKTAASGVIHGGTIIRYIPTGLIPDEDLKGFFPLGTGFKVFTPYFLSNPTVGVSTGGTYTVNLTATPIANPVTAVTVADGADNIERRVNGYWSATASGIVGTDFQLSAGGPGFGTIGAISDLRLMLAGSVVGAHGTNTGSPADVRVKRTGLTAGDLTNSFHIGTIDSTNSPLPVELLNFNIKLTEEGIVNINWTTVSEINNDYFVIERSTDGINFEFVKEIPGAGNSSSMINYKAIDENPAQGVTYYRIKQVDFDGTESFTHIEIVLNGAKQAFDVYPVPAFNQNINISLQIDAEEYDLQLEIYSSSSELIYTETRSTNGLLQTVITPDILESSGVYFLRIRAAGELFEKKFIYYK